jgi:hypothetical protein
MLYVLYPFVTYLLTLPRIIVPSTRISVWSFRFGFTDQIIVMLCNFSHLLRVLNCILKIIFPHNSVAEVGAVTFFMCLYVIMFYPMLRFTASV